MRRPENAPCKSDQATGMALSVLAEVSRLLEQLSSEGVAGSIDLRSLPLSDTDRQELEALLGRGEVTASLQVAGASEVWETAYPGVWWVRHRGAEDRIASEEIAVCRVPDILLTHPADVEKAAGRMRRQLETQVTPTSAEHDETTPEAAHG